MLPRLDPELSGFNAEYPLPLVFDIETASIADAGEYIEPPAPPSNYKDAEKIAAYVTEKHAELIARAALDPDLTRIVALGIQGGDEGAQVIIAADEDAERQLLCAFWERVGRPAAPLVGFGILGYDLRVLLRRSLYLGVKAPRLQIDKYRHAGVIDLLDELSFHGAEKFHSL